MILRNWCKRTNLIQMWVFSVRIIIIWNVEKKGNFGHKQRKMQNYAKIEVFTICKFSGLQLDATAKLTTPSLVVPSSQLQSLFQTLYIRPNVTLWKSNQSYFSLNFTKVDVLWLLHVKRKSPIGKRQSWISNKLDAITIVVAFTVCVQTLCNWVLKVGVNGELSVFQDQTPINPVRRCFCVSDFSSLTSDHPPMFGQLPLLSTSSVPKQWVSTFLEFSPPSATLLDWWWHGPTCQHCHTLLFKTISSRFYPRFHSRVCLHLPVYTYLGTWWPYPVLDFGRKLLTNRFNSRFCFDGYSSHTRSKQWNEKVCTTSSIFDWAPPWPEFLFTTFRFTKEKFHVWVKKTNTITLEKFNTIY